MWIVYLAISIGAMTVGLLAADDTISVFDKTWTVPTLQDWAVALDQGKPMLRLLTGREPAPGPRRPSQFALLAMPLATDVTLEADARPTKGSLIIVYAYRDSAHFNYLHFSVDTGVKQPFHNGVFHVYGGERVRISNTTGVAAFSAINRWYHVKVEWDGTSGSVQGFVDGQPIPALHAVDLSLTEGRVGIGSFDETGDFKDVRVTAR
jgi:hypothetical protein